MDNDKISEVERILQLLKKSCQHPDGTDDMSKGSLLLEAYCLEIQLCSATHDTARMRRVYPFLRLRVYPFLVFYLEDLTAILTVAPG
jgi:hypothetical protein